MFRRIKIKKNIWTIYTIVTIGVVLSIMLTAMDLSEDFNLNCFYNVSTVYDFSEDQLQGEKKGCTWDEKSKYNEVVSDGAEIKLKPEEARTWHYLTLTMGSNSDIEYYDVMLQFYNVKSEYIASMPYRLIPGQSNLIQFDMGRVGTIKIVFLNQIGRAFSVEKAQLSRNVPVFSLRRACKIFVSYYSIYSVMSVIIYINVKKKNHHFGRRFFEILFHMLQYLFLIIGNEVGPFFVRMFVSVDVGV